MCLPFWATGRCPWRSWRWCLNPWPTKREVLLLVSPQTQQRDPGTLALPKKKGETQINVDKPFLVPPATKKPLTSQKKERETQLEADAPSPGGRSFFSPFRGCRGAGHRLEPGLHPQLRPAALRDAEAPYRPSHLRGPAAEEDKTKPGH